MRNIFGTVVILASIGILGVSVYLAANPQEQQRQKRDEILYDDTKSLTESVRDYYRKQKDYPWGKEPSPNQTSLSMMENTLDKVKEVTDFRGFAGAKDRVAKIFVTFDEKGNEIKACFLPESKTFLFHAEDNRAKINGSFATCSITKIQ